MSWAVEPWPTPHNDEWLEGQKRAIHQATRTARNSTKDRLIANKIFDANCKAVELARLLCNRPKLSTIPVEEWTIPKYRLLFDDVAALAREFHRLGNEVITSIAPAKPVTPAQVTVTINVDAIQATIFTPNGEEIIDLPSCQVARWI